MSHQFKAFEKLPTERLLSGYDELIQSTQPAQVIGFQPLNVFFQRTLRIFTNISKNK